MKFKKTINRFYNKVKLVIYKNMFSRLDREETLSSAEYFCLEIIYLLGTPTMTEFAEFLDISSPNATYKVRQLVNKGFIEKQHSKLDKREWRLVPTQKFFDYYENKSDYVLINEFKKSMTKKECKKMDKIMRILTDTIEPENA